MISNDDALSEGTDRFVSTTAGNCCYSVLISALARAFSPSSCVGPRLRKRRLPGRRFIAGELKGADELSRRGQTLPAEIVLQPLEHANGCGGIDKKRSADTDGGGTGEHELDGVFPVLHAAHADDWDAGRAGHLAIDTMHQVERQRL